MKTLLYRILVGRINHSGALCFSKIEKQKIVLSKSEEAIFKFTKFSAYPFFLIRISRHSLPEFSHFIPEENHFTSKENHFTSKGNHFTSEENHFTSKENHFTSKGNHFTSKGNHFTSEENHFISKENHFTSEENHKRSLVFQAVNQLKKFVEVAVEHTVKCISISLKTVLRNLHHSLRNFTVIMAENILKIKPNIQPVGATLLRASVELNCKEGTFINPKSIFYG